MDEIGGSIGFFPVVGVLLGFILMGLNWTFAAVLPPLVVGALILLAHILLTGALHLDGFIDTCDGLAGHRTVEERLIIMRDSCAGGIGVVMTCALLILKFAALTAIPAVPRMKALLLMTLIARWGMVYALWRYPAARREGLGKGFKDYATPGKMIFASFFTVVIAFITGKLVGILSIIVAWIIVIIICNYLCRKLGGMTGDGYGAVSEVAEIGVLIFIILLGHNGIIA